MEEPHPATTVSELGVFIPGFSRHIERKQAEDIQTYNQAFENGMSEFRDHGVDLPELVQAWFYIEKLSVNHDHEVSSLTSVGGVYNCKKLRHAAITAGHRIVRSHQHKVNLTPDAVEKPSQGKLSDDEGFWRASGFDDFF